MIDFNEFCFLTLFPYATIPYIATFSTIDQSDDGEDNPVGTVIGVLVVLSDARLASLRLAATVALQCLNLEVRRCILELLRFIRQIKF